MKKAKILSLLLTLCILAGILPTGLSFGSVNADEYKTVYVSNRYGSDTNNGLSEDTALKTIKAAVKLIGTANDGRVIVLDGKDKDGNPEYEIYTRYNTNQPYVFGPDKLPLDQIKQDALVYDAPAHTGTITYEGDAVDSIIFSGANHLELNGPTIFRNITYVEGYNTGKNLVTRGHNFKVEGTVCHIGAALADATGGVANAALTAPRICYFPIDIVGRGNINTEGTLELNAGFTHAVVGIGGWSGSYTISKPQTVIVNGAEITTGIGIAGSSKDTINNFDIINIVYNSGKVEKLYDRNASTKTTAKAVQVICNNGLTVKNESKLVGSLGNWNMNCEAVDGCSLDVTSTAGTFTVNGNMTAIATSDAGSYSSENGVLTVPAGTYSVSFSSTVEEITVKFDGTVSDGTYYKGSTIVLPVPENTETKDFLGWIYNGNTYEGGSTVTLPDDADEINFTSSWLVIDESVSVYLDAVKGNDNNDGLSADAPVATLTKAFYILDASRSPEKYVILSGPLDIDITLPAHTNMITIMGDGKEGTELRIVKNSVSMNGPITFKNIHFNVVTTATKFLNPANDTLLFLDGVTSAGNNTLNVHYGASNTDGPKQNITINGGNFGTVYVGSYYTTETRYTAGAEIVINGGTIKSLALRADGYATNHKGVAYTEDVNITINGGSVQNFSTHSTYGGVFEKNLTIVFNNGTTSNIPDFTVNGGRWIVYSKDTSGSALKTTSTAGTFDVVGGKIAIASNDDGEAVCSVDGKLTLSAGTWNISYTDSIDEAKINVKYDGVSDGITHIKGSALVLPALDDRFEATFSGWRLDGTSYKAGDKMILPEDADEISFTSVWTKREDVAVAYVSKNGSDTDNTGATADSPFRTFSKAFKRVDTDENKKRIVVVIGEMDIDISLPTHQNMITVTGDGSGNSKLTFIKNSVAVKGPTTFENIDFNVTVNSKFFDIEDNEIVFGEGITVSSVLKLNAHFGTQNANGARQKVTINSGDFKYTYLGAYYTSEIRETAGADIVINGGNISSLAIGSDGYLDTHKGVNFTENVNITVNGGTVEKIGDRTGSYKATFGKALTLVFNNGTFCNNIANFEAEGGKWIMNSADKNGNSIKPTENAGEFEVVGGLTAVATSAEGQYISASGILNVPAGTYNITYTDVVYYTNNGTEVEFITDYEADVNTLRHNEYENKLFIGWADKDGNGVTKSTFTAGEKIYATFVDCDLSVGGDFAIKGVQIRTSGKKGMRFIIEKSEAITDALGAAEYGAVVMPTEYLGLKDVALGGTYTYNGNTYEAKSVVAEKTYKDYGDKIDYTLCMTGISKKNYTRVYRVKGYIKYTDLQGNEKILYTNYLASNLYTIAKAALSDTEGGYTEAELTYFNTIKDYVDETMRNEYFAQEKIDVVGTSDDLTTWIYRLGENGVYVREFVYDTGKGGDAVEIVQLTDTHFNYCNERDFEENYPETMSTWENRSAFRYPTTQTALNNSIQYASYSDQIIVTGDAIDYLSWGAIELLDKYIRDPYPTAIIPLGNHDPVRRMQGTVEESTSLESRLELVQENWDNDIYYCSRILSNDEGIEKVMVVALNNAFNYFWNGQAEKLAADIEICREKNIPMLVFMHVPILTRNPEHENYSAIRVGDPTGATTNLYNNTSSYVGLSTSGANKDVYDLITMNPDVVKGIFNGHKHNDYYTEIWSKNADGSDNPDVTIPQYTLTSSAYSTGNALRITIK